MAPALGTGMWAADPPWLSSVVGESQHSSPSEGLPPCTNPILNLLHLSFASVAVSAVGAHVEPVSGKQSVPSSVEPPGCCVKKSVVVGFVRSCI